MAGQSTVKRAKRDPMAGYVPLDWTGYSELSKSEQESIETQRRDLWRHGIRDPLLTLMAFEFGATLEIMKRARSPKSPPSGSRGRAVISPTNIPRTGRRSKGRPS